ncbi:MAG TPA: methyltransferase domain-containing protein [Vicinamibacterales bacterium]
MGDRLNDTVDALVSPTLKHLREHWWDDEFTAFLAETLRPRPGNRILDVGCGEGLAEVAIGRLQISQVRLYGVELVPSKAAEAKRATESHNHRVRFSAGDAERLPFVEGSFDSTFCVAVLQHVRQVGHAVDELARVTATGGRVVIVEPDNAARYAYSSLSAGTRAFAAAGRFFAALAHARGEVTDPSVGPKAAALLGQAGVEPLAVRLFPVSHVQLGAAAPEVWTARRKAAEAALAIAPTSEVRRLGTAYIDALDEYRDQSRGAGDGCVEIQHTTLFATVGQKSS